MEDHIVSLERLDLSRLAGKLVSEDGFKDETFAHETIMEYKKFFFLLSKSEPIGMTIESAQRYLPSPLVDRIWQRHILDTAAYFEDCDRFDMPGGYCHRHELPCASENDNSTNNSESHDKMRDLCVFKYAEEYYRYTLSVYTRVFGQAPRKDIWPEVYDYASQNEKRTLRVGSGSDTKLLSFALPHVDVAATNIIPVKHSSSGVDEYCLPSEATLVENLMWVGELVFDTLPLKQLICEQSAVIAEIAFEADIHRSKAVKNVVTEYARFMILVMQKNWTEMNATEVGESVHNMPWEVTPSKLVDELWHAHILCSPAYFCFW
jgi:hypothetical protein